MSVRTSRQNMKDITFSENRLKEATACRPVQLVFVLARTAEQAQSEALPSGLPKLFVHAEELSNIFGSEKVAKILAKHCLTPTIKRPSRLTLYWLGDVLAVADRLRRGEITIDFDAGTAAAKLAPNDKP